MGREVRWDGGGASEIASNEALLGSSSVRRRQDRRLTESLRSENDQNGSNGGGWVYTIRHLDSKIEPWDKLMSHLGIASNPANPQTASGNISRFVEDTSRAGYQTRTSR
jgi:hypothetical protein